jgi:hypothetical protein
MARADFGRAEYSCRNAVAHCFQCRDECLKLSVRIPWDVLAEETMRPYPLHDGEDALDEPSVVVFSEALSGEAVGLARVARSDAIHDSTPRSRVEGGKVRPDRRRMKPPFFHARSQDCGGKGFPLDVSDANRSGLGNSDAELKPSDASAEGKHVEGT